MAVSEMSTEVAVPDERPETAVAEAIPVSVFEGEYVRVMKGLLPALTLEMEAGYARGTHLQLMVEVRVRDVNFKEVQRGDLARIHSFALEQIQLIGAFTAEQADPGVGGSLAGGRNEDDDEDEGDVGF